MTRPPRTHKCAATGCTIMVEVSKLACATHWRARPRDLQLAIYQAYAPDKPHSAAYLDLVLRAIRFWRERELQRGEPVRP